MVTFAGMEFSLLLISPHNLARILRKYPASGGSTCTESVDCLVDFVMNSFRVLSSSVNVCNLN